MIKDVDVLIAKVLRIQLSQVSDDLEYQAIPEWDSLNHVELMLALESTYNVEIDGDQVIELTSVKAIRNYIRLQVDSRSALKVVSHPHKTEIAKRANESGMRVSRRADHPPTTQIPKAGDLENQRLDNQRVINRRLLNEEAEYRPTTRSEDAATPLKRGLNGVYLDRTRITFIDGEKGELAYRGYSIHDLIEHSSFEETLYLIIFGKLPTRSELEMLDSEMKAVRRLPHPVVEIIHRIRHAHPMVVLRTAVSTLAAFKCETSDTKVDEAKHDGIRIAAQIPSIISTHHAIRNNRSPVEPSQKLSHAANFLYMLNGVEPTNRAARILDKNLILSADHGSNASTFAARVVASTHNDMCTAITAAIAAFQGAIHGGACENVMKMLQEIGEVEHAAEYIRKLRAEGRPVMGFGHRVYKVEDPRVRHLRQTAWELSKQMAEPKWHTILGAILEAMHPYTRYSVNVNVDFYSGVIYHLLGIPQDIFVPIFALGRAAGWVTHVIEQIEHNILIRPLLQYVGESRRQYVHIDAR